jgi:hypothetical protein
MKYFKFFLSQLVIVLLISSCSTGSKAYRHGDYYRSCIESIDRLRSSPTNKKSQSVLVKAYPLATQSALREIQNAELANQPDKFDVIVAQYEQLNQLANQVHTCPKSLELLPEPKMYITEISQAKSMAAERAYNLGLKAMEYNTIDQAREALNYFTKANWYVKGYKDVYTKIEEARYNATLRVIVQKPLTSKNYQYSADFFYLNLMSELSKNFQNRFVHFYSEEEAKQIQMREPDQLLVLNFEDFSVGNSKETLKTEDVKRDSVVVGTVQVDGKSYKAYNTVTAQLTTFRREILSGGVLSVRFVDAQTNNILQQNNFSGQYLWFTTWSTFKGDDRALIDKQKTMCAQQAQLPPQHQEMFIEFTKPIYAQVVQYVNSTYSRY